MTKAVLLIAIGAIMVFFSLQVPGLSKSSPTVVASDCPKLNGESFPHGGMGGVGAVHQDIC